MINSNINGNSNKIQNVMSGKFTRSYRSFWREADSQSRGVRTSVLTLMVLITLTQGQDHLDHKITRQRPENTSAMSRVPRTQSLILKPAGLAIVGNLVSPLLHLLNEQFTIFYFK